MNRRTKLAVVSISTVLVVLLLVGASLGQNNPSPPEAVYRHLAVYSEVLHRVKSDYVTEPDLKSVTLGALHGMLGALDPFASYLNASQYKEYLKHKDDYKGDVGLILSVKYGYLGVVGVVPGSPAAKAGLTTLDMLESIRGIGTRDMPLAYAELLLRGEPGTTIEVSLMRMSRMEPQKITLSRAVLSHPPVTKTMLPGEIGYVRPETLAPGKVAETASALKQLQSQGAKKFVLDLRSCAVGEPEEGVALANLFLQKGSIATLKGQKYPSRSFTADPAKFAVGLPLAVITNRGTSAAAEVTAAALLDNKRAEVIGERTYGNAAVRKPVPTDDGGAVILSVAKFISPSGKIIQDTGVTPSVPMQESEAAPEIEEEPAPRPEAVEPPARPDEDRLLKKAIEVLTTGVVQAQRGRWSSYSAGPVAQQQ